MISQERLGRVIRDLRRESGLTQAELATYAGVAKQAISNLERGAVLPSLKTLEQIAATLGAPVHVLLRGAEAAGDSAADAAFEAKLLQLVRALDPTGRARALELLRLVARWHGREKSGAS